MSQDLFPLLVTQIWQVAVLAIAVWIVVRIFATDRPHLAHGLWLLVLIKCITPPIWSSPTSPFSWVVSQPSVGEEAADPLFEGPYQSTVSSVVVQVNRRRSPKFDSGGVADMPQPSASSTEPLSKLSVPLVSVWFWVGSAACSFLVIGLRFAFFMYWIRRSTESTEPGVIDLVQRLSKQLGIKRQVRVLVLDRPVGPAVVGVFRPTILLPALMVRKKSKAQLELLIAHELVHIRRGDLWWAMVQSIAIGLFWFHPLIWWATRMVTRESERSCDEETVASLGCPPAAYARGLLDVLEYKHRLRVAPALPGVRPVDITSARLERVMRLGNGSHRRTPVWVWLVTVIGGMLVLPGAALVIAQESATSSSGMVKTATIDLANTDRQNSGQELRVYDVGPVLEIVESIEPNTSAEEFLLSLLPSLSPKNWVEKALPIGQATMEIVKDKLYVLGTQDQQAAVSKMLTVFRQNGLQTVRIDVKLVTVPPALVDQLGIQWSVSGRDGKIVDASTGDGHDKFLTDLPVIGELFDADSPDSSSEDADTTSVPMPTDLSVHQLVAATLEDAQTRPVMQAILSEQDTRRILSRLDVFTEVNNQSESHNRLAVGVITAPSVIVVNGQRATIQDLVAHPFVGGVPQISDPALPDRDSVQTAFQTLNLGTTIDVCPIVGVDGDIQLSCRVKHFSVNSAQELKSPAMDSQEPLILEVPVLDAFQIGSLVDVPNGQTVILQRRRENEKGEPEIFLVLMTCQILEGMELTLSPEIMLPLAVSTSKAMRQDRVPFLSEIPIIGNIFQRSSETESQSADHSVERGVPLLSGIPIVGDVFHETGKNKNQQQKSTQANGALLRTIERNGAKIEIQKFVVDDLSDQSDDIPGHQLSYQSADGDLSFQMIVKQGEIDVQSGEPIAIRSTGAVTVRFANMEASAEHVLFDGQRFFLKGKGNVRHQMDNTQVTADEMQIDLPGGVILFMGDVKLASDANDADPIRIEAEELEWTLSALQINPGSTKETKD